MRQAQRDAEVKRNGEPRCLKKGGNEASEEQSEQLREYGTGLRSGVGPIGHGAVRVRDSELFLGRRGGQSGLEGSSHTILTHYFIQPDYGIWICFEIDIHNS
ncbi:hypothetical protein KFK09_004186 [Dendrobium nobile]|uniref:Uncharacterized protein n=1 Tax=Dendrobium nobile TaxID=94219 RepID=A0A8T3C3C2_DENNO|nr:hypothetical protein KFK09_004186 [Dendrobium nobile]